MDEQGKIYSDRAWYYTNNYGHTADLTLNQADNVSDILLSLNAQEGVDEVNVAISVVPLENLNDASLNNGVSE